MKQRCMAFGYKMDAVCDHINQIANEKQWDNRVVEERLDESTVKKGNYSSGSATPRAIVSGQGVEKAR
nr:hypothetical protein [Eubacterium oxidoreducens]